MENSEVITWGTIVFISLIVGAAWKIFNTRKTDRDEISAEISKAIQGVMNAVNRLEKKFDESHETLHGRANRQMEEDREITSKVSEMKGAQSVHEKLILKLVDRCIDE